MNIKLIITDIDGVWTDGGMYHSDDGAEIKKFNTSDSVGLLLAKQSNKKVLVVTGEATPCVQHRMKKLNVQNAFFGVKNKLEKVTTYLKENDIELLEVAFIGDEINDHALLKKVGFSACPEDAPWYTQEIVDAIIPTKGGDGAFRDFVIEILRKENKLDAALSALTD